MFPEQSQISSLKTHILHKRLPFTIKVLDIMFDTLVASKEFETSQL